MATIQSITQQFRDLFLEGTWIANTNLKQTLDDVSLAQATHKVGPHNSIAELVFHLNYYLVGLHQVLLGGPLDIRDKYSFDLEPITTEEQWTIMRSEVIANAEGFAATLSTLPDSLLSLPFVMAQYGTYEKNLVAMIEHGYYHLGQIVLLKKLIIAAKIS